MRTCAEHVQGERRLAVSISDNCLATSRRLADVAGEIDADLVVVSCPNYFVNDREMLIAYFAALADFAPADICLYDNPIASNTQLCVEDITAIHEAVPRVSHIKVTDLAIDKVAALKGSTDLVIYSGDDAVLWHQLSRGATGAMVALPMIYPEVASSLWEAFESGGPGLGARDLLSGDGILSDRPRSVRLRRGGQDRSARARRDRLSRRAAATAPTERTQAQGVRRRPLGPL